jgi:hypothetical protein
MKSRDPDGVSDLRDWLRRNKFEQYADAFEANDIDLDILPELSERDLEQLGVSLGNRRRLLKALAERAAEPAKSKPSDAEASGEAEAQLPRPSYQGPATKAQLPRPSYQGPATKVQLPRPKSFALSGLPLEVLSIALPVQVTNMELYQLERTLGFARFRAGRGENGHHHQRIAAQAVGPRAGRSMS